MNERYMELAEQAGLKVNADGEIGPAYFGSVDSGYRKFAELIVRECLEIAIEEEALFEGPVETMIRKRFGVEKLESRGSGVMDYGDIEMNITELFARFGVEE